MTLVLLSVPERQWREPSAAQPKDRLGNPNRTRFRITARLDDGHIHWRGWLDSRDDADAFLHALIRHRVLDEPMPRSLWEMPTPAWHPDVGPWVVYDFATVTYLTVSPGSLLHWTSVADWNNNSNSIECIGAGGGGGAYSRAVGLPTIATGGGGGEYRKIANFAVASPGTTTVPYQIGNVGSDVSAASGYVYGVTGGNTWWGSSAEGSANVRAIGGARGGASGAGSANGGVGGTGGTGTTSAAGGRGGSVSGVTTAKVATGGGGAGGSIGIGSNGGDRSTNANYGSNGGNAGNGAAGGGAGARAVATNGTDGTTGGGGGGGRQVDVDVFSGEGGAYGGGSGGAVCISGNRATAKNGEQGIIALTYTASLSNFGDGFLGFFQ